MSLDDVFGTKPVETIPVVEVVHTDGKSTVLPPEGTEEDVDFEFVRANHYQLAQQAQEAMQIAMKIARESEQARAIETLATLLKTASEVNRQILILSKDKADVKAAKAGKGNTTPNNQPTTNISAQQVVFTGTNSDLNKMLREKKQNDGS